MTLSEELGVERMAKKTPANVLRVDSFHKVGHTEGTDMCIHIVVVLRSQPWAFVNTTN